MDGFTTRAIRASTRAPRVDQRPTSVPISERTASLGSIHTIVVHPPSTTHRQLSAAELAEAGIAPGLLRCSVGLEDAADLFADAAQALEAARAAG
jgi:O-acetylhomoserine/O-acetylserine sulfhydrylase-like pyridoxal-dependent enzyme